MSAKTNSEKKVREQKRGGPVSLHGGLKVMYIIHGCVGYEVYQEPKQCLNLKEPIGSTDLQALIQ